MHRRKLVAMLGALTLAPLARAQSPAATQAMLYKNPNCGCCEEHASYLRGHGYAVKVIETHDLDGLKRRHGVPEELFGCHTIEIGGYVVEGHVPAGALARLLRERPAIRGISLPGMPAGSPGMIGRKREAFKIYVIDGRQAGAPQLFAAE
ncbi:MAG: DUF411 domain-containing protein [Steroidobacteraceae bacterium]